MGAGPTEAGSGLAASALDPAALGRQWQTCFTDATEAYSGYALAVADELGKGSYGADEYRYHAMWLWTNLARDWSRAWVGSYELASQIATMDRGDPRNPSRRPGGPLTDSVVVEVGSLEKPCPLTVSDLWGIGSNKGCIPASALTLSTQTAPASAGVTEVTVTATSHSQLPGMYAGWLTVSSTPVASYEPVLLYVSGAGKVRRTV